MRGLAPTSDLDSEALRPPPVQPYQRHVDRTGPPEEERATNLGELVAWCDERGDDGDAAAEWAELEAASLWVRNLFPRAGKSRRALLAMLGSPTDSEQILDAWRRDGAAFLPTGCQNVQRKLMIAARRSEAGSANG